MRTRTKTNNPNKARLNESLTDSEPIGVIDQKVLEHRHKIIRKVSADTIPSKWRMSLNEISNLKFGWDTFDGIPIPQKILKIAEKLLIELHRKNTPLPHLVPAGDGSVQLEFRKVGIEIFIENTGSVEIDHSGRLFNIGNDYSKVGDYVENHRIYSKIGKWPHHTMITA